eukprot:1496265-Prorocentrum_lima.AAC.1
MCIRDRGIFGPRGCKGLFRPGCVVGRDWHGGEGVREMGWRGQVRGPLLCKRHPQAGPCGASLIL